MLPNEEIWKSHTVHSFPLQQGSACTQRIGKGLDLCIEIENQDHNLHTMSVDEVIVQGLVKDAVST